jgi:hypothetical protein
MYLAIILKNQLAYGEFWQVFPPGRECRHVEGAMLPGGHFSRLLNADPAAGEGWRRSNQ